jgi:Mrp family chromosome partitioning ATPase
MLNNHEFCIPDLKAHVHIAKNDLSDRSPSENVKVVSVGSLLESDKTSVIFRGPRKSGKNMQHS